jgi:hypothetical protein
MPLLLLRAADIGPLCLRLFRVHGDHVRLRKSPLTTTEDLKGPAGSHASGLLLFLLGALRFLMDDRPCLHGALIEWGPRS